ncbi:MAG: hypothetical protein AUH86_09155 [Acidobacteria bacterium 13_1_40CM_4_58_4]|nr:MAG: hypothetical protein AUH86_09155 [Acidobacteria bacterium 13_1_40CM_4_58_4]
MMTFYALSGLVNGIAATALGLLVYSRAPQDPKHRAYVLFCLSIAIWSYFYFAWTLASSQELGLLFARLLMVGAIFVPATYLHHVLTLLDLQEKRRMMLRTGYAVSLIFLSTDITHLFVADVQPAMYFRYWPQPGIVFYVYLVWFAGYVAYATYLIAAAWRSATGLRRKQYSYLTIASAIGYLGGTTNFLLWFGIEIPPIGTILVTVYAGLVAYTMVRYRLLDITGVLPKSLATGLLVASISLIAFFSILVSHRVTLTLAPLLIVGLLVFAIGIQAILLHSRSAIHVRMGVLCGIVTLWLLALFMMQTSHEVKDALWWHHLAWIATAFIPSCAYHFAKAVALPRKSDNTVVGAMYLISIGFAISDVSHYFSTELYTYPSGMVPKAGPFLPAYLGYLLIVGTLALHRLYCEYRRRLDSQDPDTSRSHAIFWGVAFGGLGTLDALQYYGVPTYPLGLFGVILWICLVTPALSSRSVEKSILNRILGAHDVHRQVLAVLLCYLLILGAIRVTTGGWYFIAAGVLVATAALFASAMLSIRQALERRLMRHLFHQHDASHTAMVSSMKDMLGTLNLKTLTSKILQNVGTVMRTRHASLFLLNAERTEYFLAATLNSEDCVRKSEPISPQSIFAEYVRQSQAIIIKEEVTHTSAGDDASHQGVLLDALSHLQAELCCPITTKNQLLGFLILGAKEDSRSYSHDDLILLSTLVQTAAIALVNAQLYEDLKQSELLATKSKHLRSLMTMAGGFAHEIRNPLTSIKTFLQLMGKRKDDPEFMQRFVRTVNGDILRIERLILDILNSSKYMNPIFREENINAIVTSCLHYAQVKAEAQAIQVQAALREDLPTTWVDSQQITQVLINILLNAIEAMTPGPGRLLVQTHRLVKENESWIQIEVTDTGCGIKPEDLDHIFDPFFTTKHNRQEWEGTGLGLTVVDQIIRQHGGYIEVSSHTEQGATFVINIPADARRTIPAPSQSIRNKAARHGTSAYALGTGHP